HVPVAPAWAADKGWSSLLPFAPSLDRVFAPSDALKLYVEFASRSPLAAPKATVEIVGAAGHVHHTITPDVSPNDRSLDVQLPLTGLAPGGYALKATVTDQGRSATREIGFFVK